ncbi:carbohydrate kinase family protein [Nocardioides sp.]|uniref:carbohydrate kinase family protein n=1 Tax=Nocardioides sp. TaxID=35761 RepID=UPI003D0D494D
MTITALVIGEALVDIVAQPDGTTVDHPGGSPANVAVAMSRLGTSVGLATAYGADRLGGLLDRHFADAGVSLVGNPHGLERTSSALATIDATGAASYVFDLHWELQPPRPADPPLLVHTGSLGAVLEPGAGTVVEAIASLREVATISYDINARPAATGISAELVARVDALVAVSDVVKASDEDLEHLYPEGSIEDAVERILALGAGAVVVTWGGQGASCFSAAGRVDIAGENVEVADTIGAGDSFCAALLDGLRRRELLGATNRSELRGLSLAGWTEVMTRANRAAAITVSRPGANPPTAAELDQR